MSDFYEFATHRLETQLRLIASVGADNYLREQMG